VDQVGAPPPEGGQDAGVQGPQLQQQQQGVQQDPGNGPGAQLAGAQLVGAGPGAQLAGAQLVGAGQSALGLGGQGGAAVAQGGLQLNKITMVMINLSLKSLTEQSAILTHTKHEHDRVTKVGAHTNPMSKRAVEHDLRSPPRTTSRWISAPRRRVI
jgi:hypothetical protein